MEDFACRVSLPAACRRSWPNHAQALALAPVVRPVQARLFGGGRGRRDLARPASLPRAAERRTTQMAEDSAPCAARRASGRRASGPLLFEARGARAGAPPTPPRQRPWASSHNHRAYNRTATMNLKKGLLSVLPAGWTPSRCSQRVALYWRRATGSMFTHGIVQNLIIGAKGESESPRPFPLLSCVAEVAEEHNSGPANYTDVIG